MILSCYKPSAFWTLAFLALKAESLNSFSQTGNWFSLTQSTTSIKAERQADHLALERRGFIVTPFAAMLAIATSSTGPKPSLAGDDDLTSQLFNPDGSLKEGNILGLTGEVATSRSIKISFPNSLSEVGQRIVSVDGSSPESSAASYIQVSYNIPKKWSEKDYFDQSEGINRRACDQISVTQINLGEASSKLLEKATTTGGIAKSLKLDTQRLPELAQADLVSGRKRNEEGTVYYDFDLAVAPKTCPDKQAENLGLGFCPYDRIVLLSATLLDDNLFTFQLECTKEEWKLFNSDLKRVRQSFTVNDCTAS